MWIPVILQGLRSPDTHLRHRVSVYAVPVPLALDPASVLPLLQQVLQLQAGQHAATDSQVGYLPPPPPHLFPFPFSSPPHKLPLPNSYNRRVQLQAGQHAASDSQLGYPLPLPPATSPLPPCCFYDRWVHLQAGWRAAVDPIISLPPPPPARSHSHICRHATGGCSFRLDSMLPANPRAAPPHPSPLPPQQVTSRYCQYPALPSPTANLQREGALASSDFE